MQSFFFQLTHSYPDRKLETYWMIKGMLTCLTKQMKHQSKQHLEDGQISDEVQKGSRDVEKAAGKQNCAADLMQGR